MPLLHNVTINIFSRLNRKAILKQQTGILRSTNSKESNLLANAFESALNDNYAQEEIQQFNKIEYLRRKLLNCRDKIGNGPTITIARAALSSKNRFFALVLYNIIRAFKPTYCLELGTNMGISAAYQASALTLNSEGRLVSFEGAANRAALAKRHLEDLNIHNTEIITGKFEDTLAPVLAKNIPVDYAFIDGHHDEQAALKYFEDILRHCPDNAIIIFDDISWSNGMKRVWRKITGHPNIKFSVDLYVMGICVINKSET